MRIVPVANGGDSSVKNGVAGGPVSWIPTADGTLVLYDDPMDKVLGLDAKTSGWGAWFGFTSGSTLLLAGLMALVSVVAWIHTAQARMAATGVDEIEVTKEEPPPPPPEPETKPEPTAPAPNHARELAPPPPAPAQAAKVLTQEPNPDEPVDLTGNTIVQGNAETYAGGFTSAEGKSANAVRTMAAPTGVPTGTGPVRAATPIGPGPDRSRRASIGETEWNCPFPPEADAEQIDEAYVMLQIDVNADGTPSAVRVLSDPGNGFGREALTFAKKRHFSPALDHEGNAIASSIKVRVSFKR
jgi:protein TonB